MDDLHERLVRQHRQSASDRVRANAQRSGQSLEQYTARMTKLVDILRRYDMIKAQPLTHPSSWVSRGKSEYDNEGCNEVSGCVSSCPFIYDWHNPRPEDVPKDFVKRVIDFEEEHDDERRKTQTKNNNLSSW